MKLSNFIATLALALPSVLGASLARSLSDAPALVNTTGLDGYAGDFLDTRSTTGLEARSNKDVRSLQARQASNIEGDVNNILNLVRSQVGSGNQGRIDFTQRVVREGSSRFPQYNWVIVHTAHLTRFDGASGRNWNHWHYEFDINPGGTIRYELYWFESGTFELQGDGGFINWAWTGQVSSISPSGRVITFV
ncbi:ectomycorrhiza-regulated small secreted protein [Ephemerocybe angulata]|uniref:Ectomycorrhiza-regulated small secreted protein n=1 Tax=Ephemerocybe angulata TaxID=980116 RepID=A0A8H6I7H7_9AGAR|nr:ectomycorrhiza-regulated small secreted protein [Tulosesus angulatus]